MIQCLLVEDQTLVRLGLKNLLELDAQVRVTAMAEDGVACLNYLAQQSFDLVLLDMRMPNMNGLQVLKAMRSENNSTPVLILTTFEDCDVLVEAINLGAMGYILKNAELEHLLSAIKAVCNGQQVLQPALTRYLLQAKKPQPTLLTEKEIEVLKCMSLGLSNRAIASTLNNSEGTIRNHVSTILAKLEVADRTQAVIKAINESLV
ncbi:response regulator [Pseudoalteromonas fenneropenaei]|uniref:Response regulator n=1 Tax=Pseudoalteromonas fenneropenaei TaxID=1737459 RepID=A0ABV7CN07_9GAMM